MQTCPSTQRLIAKIVREIATQERFESYADFKDALRRRLIRLRVRYRQHEFDDAISLVASNRSLVARPVPPCASAVEIVEPRPLSRTEAATIQTTLLDRFRRERAS